MRIPLAAGVIACTFASLSPASAYLVTRPEAPWCAVMNYGFGDMHWDCSYASLEACRPNVLAGNRGFCNPNPAYAGPVFETRPRWKRHVRRR